MKLFQDGDGEIRIEELKKMNENECQLFAPGMAFVPDAPNLCEVLSAFGPRKKKSEKDRRVKKNLTDVRKSMMTLLKPKFEHELDPDDVENMRWATFVSFNRQVGDDTVMTGKDTLVQVRFLARLSFVEDP